MTNVIPVTEARKDLLKIVDEVDKKYTRVDITKNGRVKATIVSPEYLDSLEETIYTLENSMDDIREAEKAFKRGEFVTLEQFHKDFEKRHKKEKNAR